MKQKKLITTIDLSASELESVLNFIKGLKGIDNHITEKEVSTNE